MRAIPIYTHRIIRRAYQDSGEEFLSVPHLSTRYKVVVFTLSLSFYPTTLAVPPVSFLIHPMAAAETKGHEDEHTGMQEKKVRKKRKRKTKSRKQGTKASEKIVLKASPTNLPVSATKPRRGPCHTICHLPALVGNGIKCHCCRCRAPPPETNQRKPNKTAWTRAVATQVPLI